MQIINNHIKMLIRLLNKKKENILFLKLMKPMMIIQDLLSQKMNNFLHMEQ